MILEVCKSIISLHESSRPCRVSRGVDLEVQRMHMHVHEVLRGVDLDGSAHAHACT